MILTYFRSSSFNNFDNCQMQYYLTYVLGMQSKTNLAATKGNVVHKALECIALRKNVEQKNDPAILGFEEDNLGYLTLSDCEPDYIIQRSYDWHRKNFEHDWDDVKDFKDCKKWMWMVLNDPIYDPRIRHIIQAEQKFDFEIQKPWAKYDYKLPDGKWLSGYLSLKGTMDLVTEIRPGCLEIVDWKTGGTMKDFNTGKQKDFYSLHKDNQIRLYHFACHHIFPNMKDIGVTMYFIRHGGGYSVMLDENDLDETESIIKKQFERIRRTVKPRLNPGPPWSTKPNPYLANFKCLRLCEYSKPSVQDPNRSTCQFIRDEINRVGMDKVTEKFGDMDKISCYQDGGGKYTKK